MDRDTMPAQQAIQKCLDAGMTEHLPKPFSKTQLAAVVEKYFGKKGRHGTLG